MQEYINMWKNYANFSGRTSRRGYWMAFLFNVIAGFIVGFISGFLSVFIPAMTIIGTLYTIVMIVPGLSITIRRLRDAGRHWAWIFINLVPLVGSIILIVQLCKPSASVENNTAYNF